MPATAGFPVFPRRSLCPGQQLLVTAYSAVPAASAEPVRPAWPRDRQRYRKPPSLYRVLPPWRDKGPFSPESPQRAGK